MNHWMWPFASSNVPPTVLLNLMMDCPSRATTVEAQNLLLGNFCRGNVPMPKAIELDEWTQVGMLKQYATAYMDSAQWQQVRTWVGAKWR